MNTKTSYKCAHNFYDGTNHALGRDGPGAPLDMLAEVASQTLHSESIHAETSTMRKNDANLPLILSMPLTQLVKDFAVFRSDKLRKRYSYECALVPGCEKKYTSFVSESRARISITIHLADHVDRLRNNEEYYQREGSSKLGKHGKPKTGMEQGKKHRAQQGKKPQEIPNKENKLAKSEKSTSYLRKILSTEMNFKEFEREKRAEDRGRERCPMETKNDCESEFKVPGDHSYYERVKEIPISSVYTQEEDAAINEAMSENIMLMVVEGDGVGARELPCGVNEETVGRSNPLDLNEIAVPAKPKGKAKFIGTSKEEREMALVLMERIKKKGNPTGSNLQCRICDPPRSFTAPTTLVSHYRSHAGIKPYECRICRSVFTRRHSLKYHMLIHQNQTRFTCADCGKKFRHPSHFREHRRRHTGESPFGCEDCGQRFKTRNTYKRHLKTRHGKVLTTSGELLCLTEEEFKKVRTNRERKTPSISRDFLAEQDSIATGPILGQNTEFEEDAFAVENGTGNLVIYETERIEPPVSKASFEESNDRILYDGIVGPREELVDSPDEMLDDLRRCINSDYVEIEYDKCSTSGSNEFVVPCETGCAEYYERGSIVDKQIIEFPEHHPGKEMAEEDPTCSNVRYTCAKLETNLGRYELRVIPERDDDEPSDERPSGDLPRCDKSPRNNNNNNNNNNSSSSNNNNNNNNDNNDDDNDDDNDEDNLIFPDYIESTARRLETTSAFLVLTSNDLTCSAIDRDNIVVPQN